MPAEQPNDNLSEAEIQKHRADLEMDLRLRPLWEKIDKAENLDIETVDELMKEAYDSGHHDGMMFGLSEEYAQAQQEIEQIKAQKTASSGNSSGGDAGQN